VQSRITLQEVLAVTDYEMPREVARQIAVGLYRQVGEFVIAAKQDNPGDYERFRTEYTAKQAAQSSIPAKRRYTRNRSLVFR